MDEFIPLHISGSTRDKGTLIYRGPGNRMSRRGYRIWLLAGSTSAVALGRELPVRMTKAVGNYLP